MELKVRKYRGMDVLWIPFKLAPMTMFVQMLFFLIEALVETIALALATAYLVDTAIMIFDSGMAIETIYLPLATLIIIVGIISVMGSVLELIEARIKYALERHLTPALLSVRARLAYQYIEDAASWELIDRVDDEMVETFLDGIRSYGVVIRCLVSLISIGGLIITQVTWAVWVIVFCCIPLFLVAFSSGKKNYAAKVSTRKYERRYNYYTDEVLTNREAVEERTLFSYAEEVTKRYYQDFETSRDIQLKVFLKTIITMKSTSISLVVITFIIAFTFIEPLIQGEVSPGLFMGTITALFGIAETLGLQLQDATKNITEAKEYMADLTTFVELDCLDGATDLPDEQPIIFESLEFVHVRFKYPNSEAYILSDLSFKLEASKHYAFVGANGAGKTTITKLLTRCYDEYEGVILLNGKDLRTYPLSAIKAAFSVVYQDFSRYQISMADNIAIGDTARVVEKEQLLDVTSKIGLNKTIDQLPCGIDTPLGRIKNDGLDLSGGQWQKIAIARSLLSRAPIKILDEPTSALDPLAENQLYQEFEELMKGKTTIFISHRLGSTKLADEILVINQGYIAEKGSHSELMKANGLYAQMYESQREWYE